MTPRQTIAAIARRARRPACRDDRRSWLVYDGRCAFCRELAGWVRRLDVTGRVLPLDLHTQAERVACRAPHLDREQLLRAVHLISPRCEVWSGFDAVRRLARLMPVFWSTLPLLHGPGSSRLGPKIYAWVAAHRPRAIGCGPDTLCPTHAEGLPNP